jgi:hypothetical protein
MAERRRQQRWPLQMWRVVVDAHRVERWEIPASTVEVPAAHAEHAGEVAVRALHRSTGLPPWRPYLRASLAHAVARSRWAA